jgi:hypothetical protein
MATVQDVARQVLAAIDTTAGHLLCCQWVAQRYTQLCSRARFRHLRRVGAVMLPAPVTDGTITIAEGSDTVVGDATASAAWATQDLVGWHLRTRTNWSRVVARVGPATLRLASPQTEGDNVAATYQLVRRYVPLAPEARWLTQDGFVLQRTWTPLRPQPLAALDYQAPSRPLVGPWPLTWTQVESLADGTIQIEFYPISSQIETVSYVYWAVPPELAMDAEVPSTIDAGVLVEGALHDAMRYNAAKAANAGNIEAAGYWRNEYRAQNLVWERRILEAIRTDRGLDDVTLILQMQNAYYGVPQDLMTARDHIWYGWRP